MGWIQIWVVVIGAFLCFWHLHTGLPHIETEQQGEINTTEYRVFFKDRNSNKFVSPFHQVKLHANEYGPERYFNMIVEIPMGTQAKMEIQKDILFNPIAQDIRADQLRFVRLPYIWNYGAFPQTFESPNKVDSILGYKGDNDPLDVFEIGQNVHPTGSIVAVKVLGAIGLIDKNEADWKIVTIEVTHPIAEILEDIDDVDTYFPDLLDRTRKWLCTYKGSNNETRLGMDGAFVHKELAIKMIEDRHEDWKSLEVGMFFKPKSHIQSKLKFNQIL